MKLSTSQIQTLLAARQKGYTQTQIANALGITQACVSKVLKAHGMTGHVKKQALDITTL